MSPKRQTKKTPMKIAAYCRVSTKSEEQLESLQNQKDFFREYSERNGFELIEVYTDEGISGTSLNKREGFKRLLSDARKGQFDTLVVKDVSRLARNTVDFLQSIRYLKGIGINTVFLTANMQTLGDSEFILTVFSALAQEESVNLSKRIKFGKKMSARKGRVPPIIFGYDRIDNYTLRINESEAETVRLIFDLYTNDRLGCTAISKLLNEKDVKTKLGARWSAKTVRRILTNPIYKGVLINNKSESVDLITKKRRTVDDINRFTHFKEDLSIITNNQFEEANIILSKRRCDNYRVIKTTASYLFSGIIKCSLCGKSYIKKRSKTSVYYKCSTNDKYGCSACTNNITLSADTLKKSVSEILKSRVGCLGEILEKIYKKTVSADCWQQKSIDKYRVINRLENKILRYNELYTEGIITLDELKERHRKIYVEIEKAKAMSVECLPISKEKIANKLSELLSLNDITNTELFRLIEKITVDQYGETYLYWNDLPDE